MRFETIQKVVFVRVPEFATHTPCFRLIQIFTPVHESKLITGTNFPKHMTSHNTRSRGFSSGDLQTEAYLVRQL